MASSLRCLLHLLVASPLSGQQPDDDPCDSGDEDGGGVAGGVGNLRMSSSIVPPPMDPGTEWQPGNPTTASAGAANASSFVDFSSPNRHVPLDVQASSRFPTVVRREGPA